MPALLAAAAAAALAAANGPSRALPYESIRDPIVTGTAGAGWLLLHFFEDRLASGGCRWCEPPAFDAAARDGLRDEIFGPGGVLGAKILHRRRIVVVRLAACLATEQTVQTGADAVLACFQRVGMEHLAEPAPLFCAFSNDPR